MATRKIANNASSFNESLHLMTCDVSIYFKLRSLMIVGAYQCILKKKDTLRGVTSAGGGDSIYNAILVDTSYFALDFARSVTSGWHHIHGNYEYNKFGKKKNLYSCYSSVTLVIKKLNSRTVLITESLLREPNCS